MIKQEVFVVKQERVNLEIRKKFFTVGVVKHWHRSTRELADAPSLETFEIRLDRTLSNLIWLKISAYGMESGLQVL